jgi:hypothetical protein
LLVAELVNVKLAPLQFGLGLAPADTEIGTVFTVTIDVTEEEQPEALGTA